MTRAEGIIALSIVAIFALMIYDWARQGREWDAFKVAHHCHITAKVAGQAFNTITPSSNGGIAVGIGVTDEQTGWTCDDGITYFK